MKAFGRISHNPEIMGGKPCIEGTRVTVGTILGLLATEHSIDDIVKLYPYVQKADILDCLSYGSWRSEEREVDLQVA